MHSPSPTNRPTLQHVPGQVPGTTWYEIAGPIKNVFGFFASLTFYAGCSLHGSDSGHRAGCGPLLNGGGSRRLFSRAMWWCLEDACNDRAEVRSTFFWFTQFLTDGRALTQQCLSPVCVCLAQK